MPLYHFEHRETGEHQTHFLSYEDAKKLEAEGEWRMLLAAPLIVSGTGTTISSKTDRGFNDLLNGMKKFYRGSKIDTK